MGKYSLFIIFVSFVWYSLLAFFKSVKRKDIIPSSFITYIYLYSFFIIFSNILVSTHIYVRALWWAII